jgi:hypothetical protein
MAYYNPYGDPSAPPTGAPTATPVVPPAAATPATAPAAADPDAAYIAEVRASGQGKSEDYARFTDAEILAWRPWYQGGGKFKNNYGDIVDKPDERGPLTPNNRNGTGDQGDYGRGWGDSSIGGSGGSAAGAGAGAGAGAVGGTPASPVNPSYGGSPAFSFTAPTWQEAMADPGYQFALKQGNQQLQGAAAAGGVLRTSGTLKDLVNYGQDMATQQYGNVYNRQYALAKDEFAPSYGSWQTTYDAQLRKYLQKEQNIYGLISTPEPTAPSYA